ncbi:MAG: NADH dehydrogenase (ubiquinone) 1 alpha subcomplex subunit 9 [Gammaproteobacteria bacterium]|jgi:NADH dehydrogenase (ubiquinone) 1 alpha subcomplex subunit 9
MRIEALVRSERARSSLLAYVGEKPTLNISVGDPSDAGFIREVSVGCEQVVHLIGTIRETRSTTYYDAHERPALALMEALGNLDVQHLHTISILGAAPSSPSRCLRSRAATEEILKSGRPPVTIIRVPMVLGETDRASFSLAKRASSNTVFLFRAESLEQPIYAGDVVDALQRRITVPATDTKTFDLAGPESLAQRELVTRAAATLNRTPNIWSLPLPLGLALARAAEALLKRPPISQSMLRLLDHDDAIDPQPAARELGISLTSLDTMLRRCVINRLAKT